MTNCLDCTVQSVQEEALLVEAILACQKANQPLDRSDIRKMVVEFIKVVQRPNKFKDNVPGKKWMRAFLDFMLVH